MKRSTILLLASGLILAGCGQTSVRANVAQAPRLAGEEHVTYLVLSAVGQYQGATVLDKDDILFLENFVKFTGEAGTALPSEEISATSGAKFAGWVSYEGTGALTYYDKVPEQSGKILYAYFEGKGGSGGGSSSGEGGGSSTGDTVTITVTDAPNWITNDGCVIFAWAWGSAKADAWYPCVYGEGAKPTSFSIELPADATGCLLARCAEGTTTPNWDATSAGPGMVYNKSKDITITAGTTSYTSPTWQERDGTGWKDCN